ncbi:hypothetical protein BDQ17DRAFT_1231373, partial [Cyathus striatus]
ANQFMDAYLMGLDGKQAAWAGKWYRVHRVLPPEWKKELVENKVTHYDRTIGF